MNPIQYPFKNEHDVVIAMIEDFNNQVVAFNHAQTQNTNELVEIKKILLKEYADLDHRLDMVESELKDLDIKQLAKTVEANTEWITNFNNTKHIAWVIASIAFTVIGYALDLIVKYVTHAR